MTVLYTYSNILRIEIVSYRRGKGMTEKRSLLDIRATRGGKTLFRGIVLNEAVVSQGAISRLIDLVMRPAGSPEV